MVGNYDRIYISDKSDKSFIDIAKLYKTKITFFSGSKNYLNITSSPDRTKLHFSKKHKLSNIANLLQIPFRPLIRNKILVWHDWLYYSELKKRNDTLYLNSLIPWKGLFKKKRYKKNQKYFE